MQLAERWKDLQGSDLSEVYQTGMKAVRSPFQGGLPSVAIALTCKDLGRLTTRYHPTG